MRYKKKLLILCEYILNIFEEKVVLTLIRMKSKYNLQVFIFYKQNNYFLHPRVPYSIIFEGPGRMFVKVEYDPRLTGICPITRQTGGGYSIRAPRPALFSVQATAEAAAIR